MGFFHHALSVLRRRCSTAAKPPVAWDVSTQLCSGMREVHNQTHSQVLVGTQLLPRTLTQLPALLSFSQLGTISAGVQHPPAGGPWSGAPALLGYTGGINPQSLHNQPGVFNAGLPVGAASRQGLRWLTTRDGKPKAQGVLRLVALIFSTSGSSDTEGQMRPETQMFVGWKEYSYPAFIFSLSPPFFLNNTLEIHYIAIY